MVAKRLGTVRNPGTACAVLRYIRGEVKHAEALCQVVMPMLQGRRSPNIYDVARHADVSVATVSAVVNGTAYVSPRLKARVEAAIKALGYQPNYLARGLAKQQSQTVGMIVPDIANPFFPEVVRGAEDTAHAAGYSLLIASSDNDTRREELYLRLFLSKRVDGVILTKAPGRLSPDLRRAFASAKVPIVLLARAVGGFATDLVEMDDRGAAYEGVLHLHRLGYT